MAEDYNRLLENAFSKLPSISEAHVDFKIPEADSIVQGNKTIIRNFAQIADIARRSKEEIARYLTKELAAPVSIEDQRLIISVKVKQQDLNERIKKYFETYIICKECGKPDTHVESSDRGFIIIVCEACGARYTVKGY